MHHKEEASGELWGSRLWFFWPWWELLSQQSIGPSNIQGQANCLTGPGILHCLETVGADGKWQLK